ncbi:MAG: metal ABC transporter permease, partial [Alphaproteobacteria bacterium]|nr:metal ABC transporter permease [Alphaproteobacteria bacterium]
SRLQFLITLLLALCIIVSMNMVGATMIAAALVVPAASARMLTNSYNRLIVISPIFGMFISLVGLFLSYYLDAASGATIVLTGATVFSLAWLYRLYQDRFISHAHIHLHDGVEHAHPHSHDGDHAHDHKAGNQALAHSHDGIVHAHPHDHDDKP